MQRINPKFIALVENTMDHVISYNEFKECCVKSNNKDLTNKIMWERMERIWGIEHKEISDWNRKWVMIVISIIYLNHNRENKRIAKNSKKP